MLYWECKKRLESLRAFQTQVDTYFSNLRFSVGIGSSDPEENETATLARSQINRELGYVLQSLAMIGHSFAIQYTPPPLIGGFAGNINVLSNMFRLHDFQIDRQLVFDILDGGIGKYERHLDWLSRQRFNPFFWLKRLLVSLLRIPFTVLGAAGFDAAKIEESLFGKTVKAVFGLVIFLAALLQALYYLGLLEHFMKILKSAWPKS